MFDGAASWCLEASKGKQGDRGELFLGLNNLHELVRLC